MTNKQWLIKEIQSMSDEELVQQILCKFDICKSQLLGLDEYSCTVQSGKCKECYIAWLNQEHQEPIKLSDAERVILENTDEKRKWIARSELGSLQVFTNRPTKSYRMWNDKEGYDFLGPFNHLFQFITWNDSEPYNIEELLKGK